MMATQSLCRPDLDKKTACFQKFKLPNEAHNTQQTISTRCLTLIYEDYSLIDYYSLFTIIIHGLSARFYILDCSTLTGI